MLNDKRIKSCIARFTNGSYSRLQFLRAERHSVGTHTDTLQPRNDSSSSSEDDDEDEVNQTPVPAATTSAASESAAVPAAATSDDSCEVCFVAPRAGFILVPCGHARFCESCVIRSHYFRLTKHFTIVIYSKIHAQITKKTITKC